MPRSAACSSPTGARSPGGSSAPPAHSGSGRSRSSPNPTRRPPCAGRRRGRPARRLDQRRDLPRLASARRRAPSGRRRDPPGLRVPLGERRVRHGVRRGRRPLRRARRRLDARDGPQGPGQADRPQGRSPGPARRRVEGDDGLVRAAADRSVTPCSSRRSPAAAARACAVSMAPTDLRASAGARREAGSSFGNARVPERYLAVRATSRSRCSATTTATRSTSASASAPSSAATRRSSRRPVPGLDAALRERMGRRRCRSSASSATSAPAPSSSCSRRHGAVLLPGDEHPTPGRAPGHRGGHRPRPGPSPARRRAGQAARLHPGGRRASGVTLIEVRLYAEDPARDFLPTPGPLSAARAPT